VAPSATQRLDLKDRANLAMLSSAGYLALFSSLLK